MSDVEQKECATCARPFVHIVKVGVCSACCAPSVLDALEEHRGLATWIAGNPKAYPESARELARGVLRILGAE